MILFSNSSLPSSINNIINLSAPIAQNRATINPDSNSSTPLVKINSFQKYDGVSQQKTEITNPNDIFNIYKLILNFDLISLKIDNFNISDDINKLTSQRFFIQNDNIFIVTNSPPNEYRVITEIIAPIPKTPCELILRVPTGLSVNYILYQGFPLNFLQTEDLLTVDCSYSCCKIRGGELLEVRGLLNHPCQLIGEMFSFNVNKQLGLIDYVEWRGKKFIHQEGILNKNIFLWDSLSKTLKLII